jgi:hypothetical protein
LPHIEIPHGSLALHAHPSLNLNVGLSLDGIASFEAPDWSLSIAPLQFALSAPKLSKGDGLHLLRGEDGEIGISFDKNSSRHFFFFGKAPAFPKFSLDLKVYPHAFHVSIFANLQNHFFELFDGNFQKTSLSILKYCSLMDHRGLNSTKKREHWAYSTSQASYA